MLDIPQYVLDAPGPIEGRTALIDGDIILYKAAFACERNIYDLYYDHPTKSGIIESFDSITLMNDYIDFYDLEYEVRYEHSIETESIDNLHNTIDSMIDSIQRFSLSENKEIYLTSPNNFRKELGTFRPYKGGRPEKPFLYLDAKKYLILKGAKIVAPYEADDCLAIRATELGDNGIIASIDKDLKQVPGYHYHIDTGEIEYVTDEESWKNLFIQVLTGDTVDNIEGCKGIGPVKAGKIIIETISPVEAYYKCREQFIQTYGTEGNDRLTETINLIYLHRKRNGDDWKERFRI